MFSTDRFISDCREALAAASSPGDARAAVRELTAKAVSEPNAVLAELGEPQLAGLNTLYRADDLTILNIVWGPQMTLHPHDHRMWAVIGIYGGVEDNIFYRRSPTQQGAQLQRHGVKTLERGDVAPLGEDVIHAVHNPLQKLTAALHVYGGDFFAAERSEWDPDTLQEQPFDIAHTRAVFAEANRRLAEMRE